MIDCVKLFLKVMKNNSINVTYINITGPTVASNKAASLLNGAHGIQIGA